MSITFSVKIIDGSFCIQTDKSITAFQTLSEVHTAFSVTMKEMVLEEFHKQIESQSPLDLSLIGVLNEIILEKI